MCHPRVVTDDRLYRSRKNGTLMGMKKLEQDLRDAGLRKKRARKVALAADRGRAGDRAALELVEQHSAALRDSVSAVELRQTAEVEVGEQGFGEQGFGEQASRKTSRTRLREQDFGEQAQQDSHKLRTTSAKRTSTKRAPARRSTSKSTARKAPTKKAGSGRRAATRGRTTRTS